MYVIRSLDGRYLTRRLDEHGEPVYWCDRLADAHLFTAETLPSNPEVWRECEIMGHPAFVQPL